MLQKECRVLGLDFIKFELQRPAFAQEQWQSPIVDASPPEPQQPPATALDMQMDDALWEDQALPVTPRQSISAAVTLDLAEIKKFGFLAIEQAIKARYCAAVAHDDLSRPADAPECHARYARVFFESCILTCLIKLNSLRERPIDVLMRLAHGFDVTSTLPTDEIATAAVDYELSFFSDPNEDIKLTEFELSGVCFTFCEFLHRRIGLHDVTGAKHCLQACERLLAASISLLQNKGSVEEVNMRRKVQASVAEQLQRRGGSIKLSVSASPVKKGSGAPNSPTAPSQAGSEGKHVEMPGLPVSSEPVVWMQDAPNCMLCQASFGLFTRRHHCRACGIVACGACCKLRVFPDHSEQRVCNKCMTKLKPAK